MKVFFKVLISLLGIFILANGCMFMFKPDLVMGHSQITAEGAFGFSTIRGIIGGSMMATGLITLLSLHESKLDLLHPVVIILLAWTFGRLVSLFLDGFDINVVTGGLVISLVMAAILTLAHRVLSREIEE